MQSQQPLTRFARGVVRQIVLLLALFVILFATYIALGRQFVPVLSNYRADLEREIGARMGVDLRIGRLEGRWLGYEPEIRLYDLRLVVGSGSQDSAPLTVSGFSARLDILRTLRDRQPVFRKVRISGTDIVLQQQAGGWSLPEMAAADAGTGEDGPDSLQPVVDWLLSQREVNVQEVRLQLLPTDHAPVELLFPAASMANAGSQHWLDGQAQLRTEGLQADFRLRVESSGHPMNPARFSADVYLSAKQIQLDRRLAVEGFDLLALRAMQGQAEAWAYWRDGALDYAMGRVELPESTWETGKGRMALPITDGRTEFVATLDQDGSLVAELRGLHFRWRDHSSRISRVRLALNRQTEELQLVSDRLALEPANRFLVGSGVLGQRLSGILEDLGPRGEMQNIRLRWDLAEDVTTRMLLEANLADIAVNAWSGAPDGAGLNGYLRASERTGYVDLDTQGMGLGFPTLFSGGWTFDRLQTRVGWELLPEEVRVASSLISAELQGTPVRARFNLRLPFDREKHDPQLGLRLALTNASLDLLPLLLPDKLLNEATTNWLKKALKSGEVTQAGYVYHGMLGSAPDSHQRRSSIMVFDAEKLRLDFHSDWPPLVQAKARITGNSDQILVHLDTARFRDAEISGAQAHLPLWGEDQGRRLDIEGRARATLQEFRDVLVRTPLRAHVPAGQLEQWRLEGDADVSLALTLPLGEGVELDAGVRLQPRAARLSIPVGDRVLEFEQIDGTLQFALDEGLSAKRFNARLWGQKATGSIQSRPAGSGTQTTIRLQGRFTAQALTRFVDQPILSFLEGRSAYRARLDLYPGERAPLLSVDSDMQGIAINMPAPLQKNADQKLALRFRMRLGEAPRMDLQLGALLAGRFLIEDDKLSRGRLHFGEGEPGMPDRGIDIVGKVQALSLNEWLQFIPKLDARLRPAVGGAEASDLVQSLNLSIDTLDLWGYQVQDSSAGLLRSAGGWDASLRNSVLDLTASIPDQRSVPFGLHFAYLRLPAQGGESDIDELAALDPVDLPAMNLKVDEFRIGPENYGSWSFQARPLPRGLRLSSLRGKIRHADVVSGALDWLKQEQGHRTSFQASLQGSNIGDIMEAWGYAPTLDSTRARMGLDLNWPGSPAAFAVDQARGEIGVKLDRGQLYDVDPRASALRVFGVLNTNTLSRRLRLDFSDLFKKGLSYDRVRGNFALHDGVLSAQGGLSIDGPSTKIHISGDADLVNKTLDQKMIVTLPVTSNLPLAALIAGQPAVAGAIWLTEKLLGDRLERFASAQYTVQGPWDQPEVKLDKVFSKDD